MTKIVKASLALFVLAGAANPAFAQETQASAAAKFKREFAATDTDRNGSWSRAEVQARIGRMKMAGSIADADHRKRLADLWFTTADANKDGKVTEAEAQRVLTATFKRYDANGDGKLGGEERATAEKELKRR